MGSGDSDIADGNYDMVIASGPAPSSTPWTYFDSVYRLPLQGHQEPGFNAERYSDPAAWALVKRRRRPRLSDDQGGGQIYAQLEADFLQALPEIPLWYSGAWFQANTSTGRATLEHQSRRPVHARDVGRVAGRHDDRLRPGAAEAALSACRWGRPGRALARLGPAAQRRGPKIGRSGVPWGLGPGAFSASGERTTMKKNYE